MNNIQESVLSEENRRKLTQAGWEYHGKPPAFEVHDEYWTCELPGLRPRCADNPDKSMFVELQVFAKRTFPREPGLGLQLVLVGTKRDGRCARLMTYGMPEGVIDMLELDDQTAQLCAAWREMNKMRNMVQALHYLGAS